MFLTYCKRILIGLLLTHLLIWPAISQQISIDASIRQFFFTGPTNEVQKLIYLPDGKILIAGEFRYFKDAQHQVVARLQADGSLDDDFNAEIKWDLLSTLEPKLIKALAVQADGKVLVGLNDPMMKGQKIFRLNKDGSWDNSFSPPGGSENPVISNVMEIVSMPNGKILMLATLNGVYPTRLILLNDDGSFDNSFTSPDVSCYNYFLLGDLMRVQQDGKILMKTCPWEEGVKRLNADGSIDPTFQVTTPIMNGSNVSSVALLGDKVFLGGSKIVRLNNDGTLDNSFIADPGLVFDNSRGAILKIKTTPDGNLFLKGRFSFNGEKVDCAKMNANGKVVQTYKFPVIPSARLISNRIVDILITNHDKLLIATSEWYAPAFQKRFLILSDANGVIDEDYYPNNGFNGKVYSVTHQKDGKLLVGGLFSFYDNVSRKCLLRLLPDGTIDQSFNANGLGLFSEPSVIFPLENNKIVIGQEYLMIQYYYSYTKPKLVMLNEDGSQNSNFTSSLSDRVSCIVSAGDALICGGEQLNKLLPNGSIDPSFTPSTLNYVYSLTRDAEGKIIAGGTFTKFDQSMANRIARVLPDGTRDASFSTGTGFDDIVSSVAVQNDGKIVVAGGFTQYNGTPIKFIVRLNNNGSLDPSFNVMNNWTEGWARTIKVMPDGKILAAGRFVNGQSTSSLVLLNPDGSVATSAPFALEGKFQRASEPPFASIMSMSTFNNQIVLGGEFIRLAKGEYQSLLMGCTLSECKPPQILTELSNVTACEGSTVQLSIQAEGDGLVYDWFKNGELVGHGFSLTIENVSMNDIGEYKIQVTGACGEPQTKNAQVLIKPRTTITSVPNDVSVCRGTTVTLHTDATGEDISFEWLKDDLVVENTDNLTLTINDLNVGNYSVAANGACGSDIRSFLVSVLSETKITNEFQKITVCEGEPASLAAEAEGSNLQYHWWAKGKKIPGAHEDVFVIDHAVVSNSGEYRVFVHGECGVDQMSKIVLNVHPGNSFQCGGNTLTAFPNPFSNFISIPFNQKHVGHVEIKLIDKFGRTVQTWNLELENNLNSEFTIQGLEHLSKGLYILKIKIPTGELSQRMEH